MTKWFAEPQKLDGYRFDSKLECLRYCHLKIMLMTRQISDLVIHPKFQIKHNDVICNVIMDFSYRKRDGTLVVEDVKGVDTAISRLKRRLFCSQYKQPVLVLYKDKTIEASYVNGKWREIKVTI